MDFAYIATPWEWHVPMALAAMNSGKHAFVEVPAAATIEDCWKLVDTSEKTRRHCLMMENCCYGYNELMVLNMIRDGLFGDLLYGEGAYLHDLCAACCSKTAARDCGAASRIPAATGISIPRTGWGRWPITWASTAATASTTWSR